MSNHYDLSEITEEFDGINSDFWHGLEEDDLCGWGQSLDNVEENAIFISNARVSGNAVVKDNAVIQDDIIIHGYAVIIDDTW